MAEVRITKAMRFADLRGLVLDAAVAGLIEDADAHESVAFIDHEVDLLTRKGDTKGAKTKTQVINDSIKADIVDLLTGAECVMSATEIATEGGYTVQKITALLKQLVEDGRIKRNEVKGKAFFTV